MPAAAKASSRVFVEVGDSESLVELDAPAPRPATLTNRHHNSLAARVDERLVPSAEALKRTHEVGHRLRRVRPPKGGPLRMAGHETHLELRVDELPHGGETALCECLEHLAHQVDIARPHRHRLSQAILLPAPTALGSARQIRLCLPTSNTSTATGSRYWRWASGRRNPPRSMFESSSSLPCAQIARL
jgi:hypothetical protein